MSIMPSTISDLKKELEEIGNRFPQLKDEDIFTAWFVRAYITGSEKTAVESITNGPKDKGIDAIIIDDPARRVFVVQSKYRHEISSKNESQAEVLGFAHLAAILGNSDNRQFKEFLDGAIPLVSERLRQARKRLSDRKYRLCLYYVTLGKCSSSIRKEAARIVRVTFKDARFDVLDGKRVMVLLQDYLVGAAPPIPTLDLEMEKGQSVSIKGVMQRYDSRSKIESWVFPMRGDAIAKIFEYGGVRLFARNIRGFLGETTSVNKGITETLRLEPEQFFYYNNGITILCDEAEKRSSKGKDILQVRNPQIINGQQTTRMLATDEENSRRASVLVKVIQVPRALDNGNDGFEVLVSQIVRGTNWQNAIRPSDLMANDQRQIELERELRKLGYLYLRKRQSKSEARKDAGGKHHRIIKKEELAQAIAGCELDPTVPRSGRENLFEERLYLQIFSNSDPNYYLPRYWLMREVTYQARGFPERGYAKWLVLGFVWSKLATILRTKKNLITFRILCERQEVPLVDDLAIAIRKVFVASSRYYRENCGKGERAIDPSSFFRSKRGRDKEFREFWQRRENKSRKGFEKAWKKVEKAITTYDT